VAAALQKDGYQTATPALGLASVFMAQRAGSTTVQFAAASHVSGLTHYKARFVKLIEQAVKATAK
jgi:hypothetical protein